MRSPLRLGSRGSQLALWQANFTKAALERAHGIEVHIEVIRTTGDKITDVPLAQAGGTKALFTKEIEEALLDRRVDLAVHSLKDMPAELPAGLCLGAVPRREDARDALLARDGADWRQLAPGARVGTSSLRRQLQLRLLRPDLAIEPLRGNLDTRLRKLEEGRYDAIVVALAGLKRMGWAGRPMHVFAPDEIVPAIGQGALAMELREDDAELLSGLAVLHDAATAAATTAERAFLRRLGGGCQVPLAAHATVAGDRMHLTGVVVDGRGEHAVRGSKEGTAHDADEIGQALAQELLERGARAILAELQGGAVPPGAA